MIRKYFERAVRKHKTIVAAAEACGVNRTDFYKVLQRFGIKTNPGRQANRGNSAWQQLEDSP